MISLSFDRYVCLFTSKIGYSLSTTPHAICNFLSMEDIDSAAPDDTANSPHNAECSFIVSVLSRENRTRNSDQIIHHSDSNQPDSSITAAATQQTATQEPFQGGGAVAIPPLGPKPYYFRASSIAERDEWIDDINSALRAFRRTEGSDGGQRASALPGYQLRLQSIYTSAPFQAATAITVGLNFFVTVSTP
jgi:hypothetical protein